MTGRERLLRTIRGETTDRVPISPFLYYNAIYEMFGYQPNITGGYYDYFYPRDFDAIGKYVEYCDAFGFDVLHLLGSPWRVYDLSQSGAQWDAVLTESGDDNIRRREITITTPGGVLRQTENVNRSSRYLVVSAIDEHLIKTPADFEAFRKYGPRADSLDYSTVTRSREVTGDKGLACPIIHGAFNMLSTFRKLDEVMIDPLVDEGFYREMIGFFADWVAERAVKMVQAGADAVEIGGNMAGSAVGPAFFESYVRPYEQRIIDAVHDSGAYLVYHNCGDAAKIMHLYNDMSIDVLGYLTGPPFGDLNLDEALQTWKPTMTLRGNIDQVNFMMQASPSQVRQRVWELLDKVGARGRFILSTTDFFFDETPYENIRAFVHAGIRRED
ncbi:MAG: uroporphyrinogen decarboxylase family protein [Pirellulaceae bacterium]